MMRMKAVLKAHSGAWLESGLYRLAWLVGPVMAAMYVFGSVYWITPGNNFRILRVPLSYTQEEREQIEVGLKTDDAVTLQLLHSAADDDDLRALNYLGLLYDPSSGVISSVEKNSDTALAYYDKSAQLGGVHALINAGYMLTTLKQGDKACGYFEKALGADPDRVDAKAEAGYCLAARGNASVAEKAKGVELMESAGALGFLRAYYLLGLMYYNQSPPSVELAVGNFEKAVAGNVDDGGDSHYLLGTYYFRGESGGSPDYRKAIYHFEKGYEQGSASCAVDLSLIYSRGTFGAPMDFKKAFEYASFGAKKGQAVGHHNLALFYMQGKGTGRDDLMAVNHFLTAISLGYKGTLEFLRTGAFSSDFIRTLQARLTKAVIYFGPVDGRGNAELIQCLESLLNSRRLFL